MNYKTALDLVVVGLWSALVSVTLFLSRTSGSTRNDGI